MKNFKIITASIVFIASSVLLAQNNYQKQFVTIIPGAQYKAGWLHEALFGKHWRDVWTEPVKVEILDLNKFAGGLVPYKRGGGMQTKSLRLKGGDGNIWKFRSMEKDPSKILPKVLRETVVADIFQDQISSANPMGALVAAPILSSLEILQSVPYLVYMPDDPKLGEFRDDFANQLGMIEIHPDVEEDEGREFEGANKIESTFDLFKRLAEKRKEKIDAKNYLKARLADVFLGDWDRHTDQWKWARYDKGEKSFWEPIPRDRDQVFAKWDGLGPRIAAYLVPQFVHFDYEYPQVEDLTWSGRYIDRRFLTELTKAEWDSVTNFVKERLTDKVIEAAVSKLPEEHYKISSEEITAKLKSRRNSLSEFSEDYYHMINEVVDIYCTDKDDVVEVNRIDNFSTEVKVYDLKKKSGVKKILYRKVFDNHLTCDIRIHLLDGDDSVYVYGKVDSSPLVRVIGGDGKDELIDKSIVEGHLLSILPIKSTECKTEFYDSGNKTKISSGPGTYYNNDKIPKPKDEYEKFEPVLRDRSHDWLPSPLIGLNSNDGLNIGLGAQLYKYNFRMDPYEYWMNATVSLATRPGSINFDFNGIYNSIIRGSTITLDINRSDLLFTNYYGFGNETTFNEELEKKEFYRIDEELFAVETAFHINYFGPISGSIGLEFRSAELKLNNKDLLRRFKNEYGLQTFNIAEIFADLSIDFRDNLYFPKIGFYSNLRTSVFPEIFDNKETFLKIDLDAAFFYSFDLITDITLALKGGGGFIAGDYPFFESVFLGGADDLRGYTRRRFAGDASLYGQTELRTYLFPMNIVVPGRFGVHGFIESGRVFDDIFKNSTKWHPSFGGGIWVTFINNSISGSFTVAGSSETTSLYANLGMGF